MVHLILNAKSLMQKKNSGNVFLGHLGESSSYFPNPALDHGGAPPPIPPTTTNTTSIPFRIFVDHVTKFSSSLMQRLGWSCLWQKTVIAGNCCLLLF